MKTLFRNIFAILANFLTRYEYRHQKFEAINERSIEYGFVFDCITCYMPTHVLDVGTGKTALPHLVRNCGPLVTAIDNVHDFWPGGMINRHYHVKNIDISAPELNLRVEFNMITCISVLEHIANFEQAVRNMMDLLPINGYLILTFPYIEAGYYIANVYDMAESNAYDRDIPFICQSFTRDILDKLVDDNGGRIIKQKYWQCWTGEFWTAGERIIPPRQKEATEPHNLTCVAIKKNN